MQRGSSKHGPRLDDAMQVENQPVLRGAHESHVEEWREVEPLGDDQSIPRVRSGREAPPVAALTLEEVEQRSELARFLGKRVWPADARALRATAEGNHAPDAVLELLASLPQDQPFPNLAAVWAALGGAEEHRGVT